MYIKKIPVRAGRDNQNTAVSYLRMRHFFLLQLLLYPQPTLSARMSVPGVLVRRIPCTPEHHEKRPTLIIFHDPPEALGYIDVRTHKLNSA